jgi:cytochrome b involved in lipid metabolism
MKASINGPNRKKNRIGDKTAASNYDDHHIPITSSSSSLIQFKVRSLDKYQSTPLGRKNMALTLSNGDACYFTVDPHDITDSGYRLLQEHFAMTKCSQVNPSDPVLIHFHDIPIFILRANPIYLSTSDNHENENGNTIYLSQAHCHNHKICEDTVYSITCCSRPPPVPVPVLSPSSSSSSSCKYNDYDKLSAVQIQVFLRYSKDGDQRQSFPSKDISQRLMDHTLFNILTNNECLVVSIQDVDLVCSVSRVCTIHNSQDPILGSSSSTTEITSAEACLDEPFRGRVSVQTEFYIEASNSDAVHIQGSKTLPEGSLPEDVIHVTTCDDEWFPVRRILLAPCLHLTKYVQAGRGKYKDLGELSMPLVAERSPDAPEHGIHCKVDIDCCTFDRILLFIMSQLYPKEYKFALDLSEANALSQAAEELGLISLKDLCQSQLSSFASRVRKDKYIRFSEVKARNESNELLIIVDGMVLDISRWIDEHPGGPSIIPSQALNVDCTCFFEMYHVSRQSFLYLKSFYIGELNPADLVQLKGNESVASVGFLHSLRSYTDQWRVEIEEHVGDHIHKSL